MKRILSILLFVVYLSGILSPFYAYAGYYLHKDYVAENLCINQSAPELDCEGKCYLKKQIVLDVTKNAGQSTNLPNETSTNFFTPHFSTAIKQITHYSTSFIIHAEFNITASNTPYSTLIFSPPEFLV